MQTDERTGVDAYTLKRIDELASINHGAVKLAADGLGVQSFGLQVLDLPAGFTDYPDHDHAHDGQEEVYAVLDGSVTFEVAGEVARAEAGTMVRVGAHTRRKIVPGPSGARVLAIGCTPGGGYTRPEPFRSETRA